MRKNARRGACLGFGFAILVGCGSQAVEFPSVGGGAAASTSCTKASQCTLGEGCVNGLCGACTTSADCNPGEPCNGGRCGPCTANAQCPNGQACVSGACGGCTGSDQCEDGKVCALGQCGPCTSNSQCLQGQICVDGACSCSSDAQCPGGQKCVDDVCKKPASGDAGTGDGGGSDAGVIVDAGNPDACGSKPVYKTLFPNVSSMWSFNGKIGTEAGNEMCKFVGADHFCDYEEIKKAESRGELAGLNTTVWIHRTTTAVVNGVANSGGSGARCDDWRYNTNHINNGEFATISGGAVTYQLAPANMLTAGAAPSGGTPRVCGGMNRSILCCHPRCP